MTGYYDFNEVLSRRLEEIRRYVDIRPLILGAISASGGGTLGRPGGFIGTLPQTRVSYDLSELGLSGTNSGSPSLLDNLNHIRYRLGVLETASGSSPGTIVVKEGGVVVASGITVIDFLSGFSVNESPTGEANITITTSGGHAPVTVTDTGTIDLTLVGQDISGIVKASGISLGDLGDVDAPTPASGEVLKYIGAKWIPATVSGGAGHDPVTILDTGTVDLTLNGQQISAIVKASGIDHNSLLNTHNLTTDIDHDQLTNFTTTEHFTQGAISITASQVSDFDTEVSNNTDVAANTAARHSAVTVLDTGTIDLTVVGQQVSAVVKASGISHTALQDIGTNSHATIDTHIADTSIHFDQLGELSDVSVGAAASGQYLKFNGSLWYPSSVTGSGGGASYLNELGDVTLVTLASGQVLTYNGSYWTNLSGVVAGHTHTSADITDLADITVSGTATLQLVNDGVNLYGNVKTSGILLGDLGDTLLDAAVSGQVLTFLGNNWVATTVSGGSGHNPVTVLDTGTVDLTLNNQEISAIVKPSGILLGGLGDVNTIPAVSGYILKYLGTNWAAVSGITGAHTHYPEDIIDLIPINVSGTSTLTLYSEEDILYGEVVPAGINIEDLGNVTVLTPASGEVLKFIGAKWINSSGVASHTHTSSDITDLADITVSGTSSLTLVNDGTNLYGYVISSGVDHDKLINTHNLTTDIDHNTLTNTHNLTTDIDHDQLTNFTTTEHFTEGSIDHTAIQNIGSNSHTAIDNHISDTSIHFDELDELADVVAPVPASGQVLQFMGTNWRNVTPSAGHSPVTVLDTGTIDLTLNGQEISGIVKASGISHTDLQNIGTNTHSQIDTHISSTSNPHQVDYADVSGQDASTNVTAAELEELSDGSQTTLHTHDYAPSSEGVTNGDSHDHSGGDGAQIDHGGLSGLTDDDHTQYALVNGTRAFTGSQEFEQDITLSSGTANINMGTNGYITWNETLDKFSFGTNSLSQEYLQISPSLYWINSAGFDLGFRVDSQNIDNILSINGEGNYVGVGGIYLSPWRVYLRNTVATEQGIHINQSQGDYDTVIEGNTDTNLLYVDAGANRVGISTNTPEQLFHVDGGSVLIKESDTGYTAASVAGNLIIEGNDYIGMTFLTSSGVGQSAVYFSDNVTTAGYVMYNHSSDTLYLNGTENIFFRINGNTAGYFASNLNFYTKGHLILDLNAKHYYTRKSDASAIQTFTMWSDDIFNYNISNTDTDFRFRGTTDNNLIYLNAGADKVGIGTNTPEGKLHIYTGSAGTVTANTAGDELVLEGPSNAGLSILSPSNTNQYIMFGDPEDSNKYSMFYSHIDDTYYHQASGIVTVKFSPVEFVFNWSAEDKNFVVKGDNDINLLFLDAGTDKAGIGTNAPVTKLEVDGVVTASGFASKGTLNGTNLIYNYPSLEFADGATPEWWDTSSATVTEEDATGESLSSSPNERVIKVVTSATNGRAALAWVISYEPQLYAHATVSAGCWIYNNTAGTVTFRMRENGVGTISEDTTTTTGGWTYLEIPNQDAGSGGNLQLWFIHSASSATFYIANPVLNVGASVIPFKQRGVVYRLADSQFYSAADPGGSAAGWQAQDITTYTSNLAVMATLTMEYYNNGTANAYIQTRPTGQTVSAAHNVMRGGTAGTAYKINTFTQLLNDSQSFDFYSSANASDAESLIISTRGYWEWE